MAVLLSADLLRDSGVVESGDFYEINRTFEVSIVGAVASFAQAQALTASGLPLVGDQHPQLPLAICSQRRVEPNPNNNASVWVIVTYRWPKAIGNLKWRPEFGTSLRQIRTGYTGAGDRIKVSYQWVDATGLPHLEYLTPEVGKLQVIKTIKLTKYQKGSPGSLFQRISGKTNDSEWEGGQAMSWLVTGTHANIVIYGTNLANSWYEVVVNLEQNEDTWTPIVYYTNFTGHIPPDIAKNQPTRAELLKSIGPDTSQFNGQGYCLPNLYLPIDYDEEFQI